MENDHNHWKKNEGGVWEIYKTNCSCNSFKKNIMTFRRKLELKNEIMNRVFGTSKERFVPEYHSEIVKNFFTEFGITVEEDNLEISNLMNNSSLQYPPRAHPDAIKGLKIIENYEFTNKYFKETNKRLIEKEDYSYDIVKKMKYVNI
jgi:hypothetical protein